MLVAMRTGIGELGVLHAHQLGGDIFELLAGLLTDDTARLATARAQAFRLGQGVLAALASRPGRVLQRETLLREVWQTDWEGNLRLVEAHMSNLRRKLVAAGLNSPEIRTVRGVGYRLVAA